VKRMYYPPCGCGQSAIGSINGVNVCINCYSRFEAANMDRLRMLLAMYNYFQDQMEDTIGLRGLVDSPRFQIPASAPVIATRGPMTFHNINVSGGVVGAINTGQAQKIDVAIGQIRMAGGAGLADSLKKFTEAVLANSELQRQSKEELLEQLSFLTDQTLTEPGKRKTGMIRTVFSNIGTAVSVSSALFKLWEQLHPLLERVFQHSPS
jgi:hypothetical protein